MILSFVRDISQGILGIGQKAIKATYTILK